MKTFREMYCERHGLDQGRFVNALLVRAWYPHARPIGWLLNLIGARHCEPDREFVRAVGELQSRRRFGAEAEEFSHHPDNRNFSRRVLRVRVSAKRMQRTFDEVMAAKDTQAPMG